MIEEYIADSQYKDYFAKLNGLRSEVAQVLAVRPGMRILDVATGCGHFAIEVARLEDALKVTGVDISENSVRKARENLTRHAVEDRVQVLEMDATNMAFDNEEFDMAVNFAGMEDIHMTKGKHGVRQTFLEVNRVLKPDSYFCFVVMPPEEMETRAQQIEAALFSYICSATWLSAFEYEDLLKKTRFRLIMKTNHYTGKKLTPGQAREEIRFACENVPRAYRIKTRPFDKAWARFGSDIEEHGLGHYSKVMLFIAQKVEERLG